MLMTAAWSRAVAEMRRSKWIQESVFRMDMGEKKRGGK